MIVEYIKGSILDAPQQHIAHGVNCQNKMGSGVAKVLFQKYPEVKEQYHAYHPNFSRKGRWNFLLGRTCPVCIEVDYDEEDKVVWNCYTQEYYGYDGKRYVNYAAIAECFTDLKNMLKQEAVKEIAIPKIGCGLAGGDWEIVEQIINDATGDDLDVYVYYLED